MSGLVFSLRQTLSAPLDLSSLLPGRLAESDLDGIRNLQLHYAGERVALNDLFSVQGQPGPELLFEQGSQQFFRLGAELDGGRIEVAGPVGDEAGRAMQAGELLIRGGAGERTGAGMQGGVLEVRGRVGDELAAPLPGQTQGMGGGTLIVGRDAGACAGERMRRGVIVIKGDAGPLCGARMMAGTLAVLGQAGEGSGLGMQRGTLLLTRPLERMPSTFNAGGCLELPFLGLLYRQLAARHRSLSKLKQLSQRVEVHCGDAAFGGKGELLITREAG